MKQNITTHLFLISFFILFSCGTDTGNHSDSNTGAYHANLVFPDDIARIDDTANVIHNIDCEDEGIAVLRFAFYDADDTPLVEDLFLCSDHHGTVRGIPAGSNRRVVITAEDENSVILLHGGEDNITIYKNQNTQGGDITLVRVNPDNQDLESFTNDFDMKFNLIQAGTFMIGSPEDELGRDDDEVLHQVTLTQDFYMQTTEVTQGQWLAVMGLTEDDNPSIFPNCGLDCPVEGVSWDDVQEFITRLNAQSEDDYTYRLPTEAEWEYAARAGSETAFYGGDITEPEGNDPILNTLGWYSENTDATYEGCSERNDGRCIGLHPVAEKSPNAFGLYDMHGNADEWCSDSYGDYTTGSVTDPQGPSSGFARVLRGGSWGSSAMNCRSADRFSMGANLQLNGFRLVASLSSN